MKPRESNVHSLDAGITERKKVPPVNTASAAALSHSHDCSKKRNCNSDRVR